MTALKEGTKQLRHVLTPHDLGDQPRWVTWREEIRRNKDGTEKKTKVPYNANRKNRKAHSDDPSTWGTYAEAQRAVKDYDGIGIVLGDLGDGTHLMGIDLDRCINPETRKIFDWATEVIRRFDTYAEVSPSGSGVKLLFLVDGGDQHAVAKMMGDKLRRTFPGGDHREIALDRVRYYTITDRVLKRRNRFRLVSIDDIRWLMEEAGPAFKAQSAPKGHQKGRDETPSGYGFRFLLDCKRKGMKFTAARRAILDDKGIAGDWARRDDGARAIKLAWSNITAAPTEPKKEYELVCAADIEMKPLQWLWPGHLLRGAQELMTGRKGLGKSQIQCSLIACATTGRDWPDGARGSEPGNVIMVTTEDSREQVIKPRLIAARADLKRVFFLKSIRQDDKMRTFLLGEDLDLLEQMIASVSAVLVTIDPITAFMGKLNSHNTTDVRGQLGPLADLAERTNVAFSTITHPPKQGNAQAVDQFVGSQAFITAARIGHLCLPEMKIGPNGAMPTGRNLFTTAATNHKQMETLAYRIAVTEVSEPYARGDREAALRARINQTEAVRIEWDEPVEMSADEAIAASSHKASTTQEVDDFLRNLLRDGAMKVEEINKRGKEKGYSHDQLWRARKRVGATSRKAGLSHWEWALR